MPADDLTQIERPIAETRTETHAAELARAAIPRLRLLAGLFAILVALMLLFTRLVELGVVDVAFVREVDGPSDAGALVAALLGALALLAVSYTRAPPHRLLTFAMLYQIYGAFCIAFVEESAAPGRGVSVVCVWILTFTLLPTSPARTAIAAYGAALMGPLALAVRIMQGSRVAPTDVSETLTFVATLIAATLAVIIAKVIYGLGREVADARKLGAYALVEQLGQGGMGEVWRAEHRSLIRPAAIKLMRREVTSHLGRGELATMTKRFQREVQATARLTSPHTVAVYDFGATPDGLLYYVMELLRGLDAEQLVTSFGPQPAERVVHLLRQATESLAEAHHRGLVHRDIKPANLYICAIGMELDFVKILDFGLVHDAVHDQRLTQANAVSGTPAYVAPESAAEGRSDARSDLYALGCVAYWLLTGTTVFEGATSAAVIAAHIHDAPEPPSRRTELAIPAALEALVLACLAKDPEARPQTAGELGRRLAEIALPAWTPARAEAWWRTHVPDLLARARDTCHDSSDAEMRQGPAPVRPDAEIPRARRRAAAEATRGRRPRPGSLRASRGSPVGARAERGWISDQARPRGARLGLGPRRRRGRA